MGVMDRNYYQSLTSYFPEFRRMCTPVIIAHGDDQPTRTQLIDKHIQTLDSMPNRASTMVRDSKDKLAVCIHSYR
jgi:hypothetical protein